MAAQAQLQARASLPSKRQERNMKDTLFNGLVDMFKENQLFLSHSECQSFGNNFISILTDVLWCIDGHHDTFKMQSLAIPDVFQVFSGYNLPERSKHRKRTIANLSGVHLRSLSQSMFGLLQAHYWKRSQWITFQPKVECLANNLARYSEYLNAQNKKAKLLHASEVCHIRNIH